MNPDRVRIEVSGAVADVRLVRGDKHNALDWEMFTALDEATDELVARSDVRAVVLSGEGPSFCSGLDFPSFMSEPSRMEEIFARRDGDRANLAQRISYDWQRLPMPVIAPCAATASAAAPSSRSARTSASPRPTRASP